MRVQVVGLVVQVVPAFILFCGGGGGVHRVQVVQGFEASGPAGCWRLSSGRVFPPFVRSLALCLSRCLQIWLYLAF